MAGKLSGEASRLSPGITERRVSTLLKPTTKIAPRGKTRRALELGIRNAEVERAGATRALDPALVRQARDLLTRALGEPSESPEVVHGYEAVLGAPSSPKPAATTARSATSK